MHSDLALSALLQVSHTQGYAALSKRQTDVITAEACTALAQFQKALQVFTDASVGMSCLLQAIGTAVHGVVPIEFVVDISSCCCRMYLTGGCFQNLTTTSDICKMHTHSNNGHPPFVE